MSLIKLLWQHWLYLLMKFCTTMVKLSFFSHSEALWCIIHFWLVSKRFYILAAHRVVEELTRLAEVTASPEAVQDGCQLSSQVSQDAKVSGETFLHFDFWRTNKIQTRWNKKHLHLHLWMLLSIFFLLSFFTWFLLQLHKTCQVLEKYLSMRVEHPNWFQKLDIQVSIE